MRVLKFNLLWFVLCYFLVFLYNKIFILREIAIWHRRCLFAQRSFARLVTTGLARYRACFDCRICLPVLCWGRLARVSTATKVAICSQISREFGVQWLRCRIPHMNSRLADLFVLPSARWRNRLRPAAGLSAQCRLPPRDLPEPAAYRLLAAGMADWAAA